MFLEFCAGLLLSVNFGAAGPCGFDGWHQASEDVLRTLAVMSLGHFVK